MSIGGRSKVATSTLRRRSPSGIPADVGSPGPSADFVYMIGADDGASDSPARVYNAYFDTWAAIDSPPTLFADGVCTRYSAGFIVGGGYDVGGGDSSDWYYYAPFDGSYTTLDTALTAHLRAGIASTGNSSGIVAGGATGDISFQVLDLSGGFPGTWVDSAVDQANIRTMAQDAIGGRYIWLTSAGLCRTFSEPPDGGGFSDSGPWGGNVTGTATDSIRMVNSTNGQADYYAIRVQGGTATTWFTDRQGALTWSSTRAPLPRVREGFGVDISIDGSTIYVVGGDGTPYLDIYDVAGDSWTTGADLDVNVDAVSIALTSAAAY